MNLRQYTYTKLDNPQSVLLGRRWMCIAGTYDNKNFTSQKQECRLKSGKTPKIYKIIKIRLRYGITTKIVKIQVNQDLKQLNDSTYKSCLGYFPISSSAPRPLGAAYVPILLSEVEQEQRPSGNGDREALVVGSGLCDGEDERAYICLTL